MATSEAAVLIGGYTGEGEPGLLAASLTKAGVLVRQTCVAHNASYFALTPPAPDGSRYCYAVGETATFGDKETGSVASFKLSGSGSDVTFTEVNRVSSGGTEPCHVAIHGSGKWLFVSNYSDKPSAGSLAVIAIGSDGSLAEPSHVVVHTGSGPDGDRQTGPHMHCSAFSKVAGDTVYAVDLGADAVFRYTLDPVAGTLAALPSLAFPPGTGPRTLVWHPTSAHGFITGELDNTVATVLDTGVELSIVASSSCLPDPFDASGGAFSGRSYAAQVQVHPNGRFVYVSNRGHDSIHCMTYDEATGRLSSSSDAPTDQTPRCFALSPDGTKAVAVNQHSKTANVFDVDPATGAMTPAGTTPLPNGAVVVAFL